MSAIAGIFLAEELSNLSVETLTLFIVDAFAAAIIGRLKSLPLTYVGGMIIGLSIAFQQNFLTWSGRWSSASFAIPTMILFLALAVPPPGAHRRATHHQHGHARVSVDATGRGRDAGAVRLHARSTR